MKAKEYFDKYNEAIVDRDENKSAEAIASLLDDMRIECGEIIKNRKAQSIGAILSCHKEQNVKFNAIVRLFEKKYGYPVLKKDGYKTIIQRLLKDKIPTIEELWEMPL